MTASRYQWMVMEDEALDEENARRINKKLIGTMCPDREAIVEKMRRKYSRYGRRNEKK